MVVRGELVTVPEKNAEVTPEMSTYEENDMYLVEKLVDHCLHGPG